MHALNYVAALWRPMTVMDFMRIVRILLWEGRGGSEPPESSGGSGGAPHSAELKGPRKLSRIRLEIFDFETGLGPKLGQTKPNPAGLGGGAPRIKRGALGARPPNLTK